MLDQIESQIAFRLAQRHIYPFAQNMYLDIFRSFSHFPIIMEDIGVEGPGKTITYISLVVKKCFDYHADSLQGLYQLALSELQPLVSNYYPQDCTVETFLGAALYHCHPSSIRNNLCHKEVAELFNEKQLYEFHLKKKTISINML